MDLLFFWMEDSLGMSTMTKTRVWVALGLVAVVGCLAANSSEAALFGLFKGKSKSADPVQVSNLVVFPFDQAQGVQLPAAMGESFASALRSILVGSKQYSPLLYRDRLAPIKRARDDSSLKPREDVGPFAEDRTKPLKLARLLAADYFVAGAIEEVRMDSTKKAAELTVSMELVDVKSGRLVKTLLVTGRTPDNAIGANQEDAVALAAGDAVAKLHAQLLEEVKPTAVVAPVVVVEEEKTEAPAKEAQAPAKPTAPVRPTPPSPAVPSK